MACLRALAHGASRCPQPPRIVRRYASNKADPSVPEVAVGSEVGRKLEIALGKATEVRRERLALAKEQAAAASAAGYASAADAEGGRHSDMPASLAQRIGETPGFTTAAQAFPADVVAQLRRPDPDSFKQPADPHVARVVVVGLENSGKSALMNHIIGEHVSPVSYRAYSSRRWTQGIHTFGSKQLLLLDTPPLYAPLPLWKHDAKHTGAKFISECRRRILCTESVWEALHSADGVLVAVDGQFGVVSSEALEMLESLQRRLDALDRRVRVFVAVTRLDDAEDPATAFATIEKQLAEDSTLVPDGIYGTSRAEMRSYSNLRNKLLNNTDLFLPAKHLYEVGTLQNRSKAEWVADLALEKFLRFLPSEKNYPRKHCKVDVVGWTKNQGENKDMLAIDLLITVGNHALKAVFLENISPLTKKMHEAARRTLGTSKLQFFYHFSVGGIESWTWENPYGHYKPAWRYADVDPEILREDPS